MKSWLLAGVLALTALAYANSMTGQFQFDDVGIQSYVGGKMPSFVEHEMGIRHRPIPWWTFSLDYKLGGGDPKIYHATNLLIHLVSVALVFGIVFELLGFLEGAAFGALIFGVHPFYSSAVAYIYGRVSMMAAMFIFAAIYASLRMKNRWRWPVTALFFCLAVASKEEALLAPVLVLGYAVIHRRWRLAALMAGSGLLAILAVMVLAPQVGTPLNTQLVNPVWDLVLNYGPGLYLTEHWQGVLNGYVFHTLGNLLLPLWLTPDPSMVYGGLKWAFALLVILVMLIVLVFARQKEEKRDESADKEKQKIGYEGRMSHSLNYGIGFRYGIVALLACPILGALWILMAEPLFEYRAYMTGLGTALIAATVFQWTYQRAQIRSMSMAVSGLLVGALLMGTIRRNDAWHAPIPLWEDAHAKDPLKKRAILNLSAAFMQTRRLPDSEKVLIAALKVDPGFRAANVNLAAVYIESNDCDRGDYYARRGIPVAIAYSYVALCQLHDGHQVEALKNAATSMKVDPTLIYAREIYLGALAQMGRGSESVTELESEVQAQPKDAMTRVSLAIAYRLAGAERQAKEQTKIAETLR